MGKRRRGNHDGADLPDRTRQCPHCHWRYPVLLLQPFVGSSEGKPFRTEACGPCALKLSNDLHGVTRERFDGEMAEELRLDCLHWRRLHPEHAPPEATNA